VVVLVLVVVVIVGSIAISVIILYSLGAPMVSVVMHCDQVFPSI
jgi:hypothetical protein